MIDTVKAKISEIATQIQQADDYELRVRYVYTDDYEVPVNCNVDRLGHNHMPQQNMYSIHTSQKN